MERQKNTRTQKQYTVKPLSFCFNNRPYPLDDNFPFLLSGFLTLFLFPALSVS